MRSNGAVHIGNDTFVGVTRDDQCGIYLITSAFSADNRVARLELNRRVHFVPKSTLVADEPVAAQSRGKRIGGEGEGASDWTFLARHSLHASVDGHQVAAISSQCRPHYIIDLRPHIAHVCEFATPEIVRSVCWHPTFSTVLLALLDSGTLEVYDTSASHLGAVLPRAHHVLLKRAVGKFLNVAETDITTLPGEAVEGMTHARPPAPSPGCKVTLKKGAVLPSVKVSAPTAELPATLESICSSGLPCQPVNKSDNHNHHTSLNAFGLPNRKADKGPASGTLVDPSRVSVGIPPLSTGFKNARCKGAPSASVASVAKGGAKTASSLSAPLQHNSYGKSLPQALGGSAGALTTVAVRSERCQTSPLDFVDMCIVQPTRSMELPVLLLLSSSGDVFSIRLDHHCLPLMGSVIIDDGRLFRSEAERQAELRKAEALQRSSRPVVHHVIRSAPPPYTEEALAVRCFLLDEDSGVHAVAICFSSGVVKGLWVDEPGLIARDIPNNKKHLRHHFHIQLGPSINLCETTSSQIPSTSRFVQMTAMGNICLVRYADAAYVIAFPVWSIERRGWVYWKPCMWDKEERLLELMRFSLTSANPEIPIPLSFRVPLDVTGASLAIGCRQLLVVPEVGTLYSPIAADIESLGTTEECPRECTITMQLPTLMLSALYARSKGLSLSYPVESPKGIHNKAAHKGVVKTESPTEHPSFVTKLLEQVVCCHRSFLCGHPQCQVDLHTASLAAAVESTLNKVTAREDELASREEVMRRRLEILAERVGRITDTVEKWRATILDAIVHRRGVGALHKVNDLLGDSHELLLMYEKKLGVQESSP